VSRSSWGKFHEITDFALSSQRCESSVKSRKANLRADVSGIKLLRQRREHPVARQDVQCVCYGGANIWELLAKSRVEHDSKGAIKQLALLLGMMRHYHSRRAQELPKNQPAAVGEISEREWKREFCLRGPWNTPPVDTHSRTRRRERHATRAASSLNPIEWKRSGSRVSRISRGRGTTNRNREKSQSRWWIARARILSYFEFRARILVGNFPAKPKSG